MNSDKDIIVKIKPLNGKNYLNWKCRVVNLLKGKELSDVIEKQYDFNSMIYSEKFLNKIKKKDNKVKSIIVQLVDDTQLQYIRDKQTAYEMWDILEKLHEKKGRPGQYVMRKKMLTIKLEEGGNLEQFLINFDSAVAELRGAGGGIDENDLVWTLLMNLPKSYSTFISLCERLPDEDFNLEVIKIALRSEEEKRKAMSSVSPGESAMETLESPAAFNVENQKKCYRCGKEGHLYKQCPQNRPVNRPTRGRGNSYPYRPATRVFHTGQILNSYRGRGGFNPTRFFRPRGALARFQSPRGFRGRYHPYGMQHNGFYNGLQIPQLGNLNNGNGNGNGLVFAVPSQHQPLQSSPSTSGIGPEQVNNNVVNQVSNNNSLNRAIDPYAATHLSWQVEAETGHESNLIMDDKVIFYLDSGTTDHIVNDDSILSDVKILNPPIVLGVAKHGNSMQATKIGSFIGLHEIAPNKKILCIIKNVLFVKTARNNLLSAKKMDLHGLSILIENGTATINRNKETILKGQKKNLYEIVFDKIVPEVNSVENQATSEI